MNTLSNRQRSESRRMIRQAWPNRHTHPLRAGTIIRANIAALRADKAAT